MSFEFPTADLLSNEVESDSIEDEADFGYYSLDKKIKVGRGCAHLVQDR